MIDLVFGLHLYQPPNQKPDILKKITEESYLPLINLILSHPKAFFAVDIARSAVENLRKQDSGIYFIEKLKTAVGLKKISPVNTAAYHPILPLLPEKEIIRQAALNEEIHKDLFQKFYQKPDGFFPPEMAFSQKLLSIFKNLGYCWTITADTPFVCFHKKEPPFDWIPRQKNVAIFLRSNLWSNRVAFDPLSGKNFIQALKKNLQGWFKGKRGYLIIWMDWETFGHHRPNFIETFLVPFLDNLGQEINLASPADLLERYSQKEVIVPPGSWSTSAEDFGNKNYWPLWKNPNIEFHKFWWELAGIILKIKENIKDKRKLEVFDKALYSCQTWQWSRGSKERAIRGIGYFKEIIKLKEAEPHKKEAAQLIEKLEELCK